MTNNNFNRTKFYEKNTIFAICIMAISFFSFAQENENSKFGYGIDFGYGNSTLEHNQFGVLNGNVMSLRFNIDYSFTNNNNTKFISGIQISDFNSNFYNGINQNKFKNKYLQIPLKFLHKINVDKEEKLHVVVGLGTYTNLLLRSKVMTLEDKTDINRDGVNFAYNILFGI